MSDDNERIIDVITNTINNDDKDFILKIINERLSFGRQKYGHGVRVRQNLSQYETNWSGSLPSMDWTKMMLEEVVDGLVYTSAQIILTKENGGDISHLENAMNHLYMSAQSMIKFYSNIS